MLSMSGERARAAMTGLAPLPAASSVLHLLQNDEQVEWSPTKSHYRGSLHVGEPRHAQMRWCAAHGEPKIDVRLCHGCTQLSERIELF